jgi:DNA repair exonuclease SbcCD ATPase subunit
MSTTPGRKVGEIPLDLSKVMGKYAAIQDKFGKQDVDTTKKLETYIEILHDDFIEGHLKNMYNFVDRQTAAKQMASIYQDMLDLKIGRDKVAQMTMDRLSRLVDNRLKLNKIRTYFSDALTLNTDANPTDKLATAEQADAMLYKKFILPEDLAESAAEYASVLDEQQKEVVRLQTSSQQAEASLSRLGARLQEVMDTKEEYERSIAELRGKLAENEEARQLVNMERDELVAERRTAIDQERLHFERKLAAAQAAYNSSLETSRQTATELATEKRALETRIAAEKEAHAQRIREIESRTAVKDSELQTRVAELQRENEALRSKLALTEQTIEDLRAEIEKISKERAEFEEVSKELDKNVASLTESRSQDQLEIAQQKRRIIDLEVKQAGLDEYEKHVDAEINAEINTLKDPAKFRGIYLSWILGQCRGV